MKTDLILKLKQNLFSKVSGQAPLSIKQTLMEHHLPIQINLPVENWTYLQPSYCLIWVLSEPSDLMGISHLAYQLECGQENLWIENINTN